MMSALPAPYRTHHRMESGGSETSMPRMVDVTDDMSMSESGDDADGITSDTVIYVPWKAAHEEHARNKSESQRRVVDEN